jgi:hypothetical protein
MAIILFKKGTMHKIRGIPCEFQICNEYSYLHLLKQGWHYTPEECYAEPEPEVVEVPEEIPDPELSEDELKEEAIRKAARDAGIDHWWNKSIERLTSELKEQDDAGRS